MRAYIPLAIVYDFDGTLAPGNMQERDFIPAIGMTQQAFWDEVNSEAKQHQADNILVYMKLMLDKARQAQVTVQEDDFKDYGRRLSFYEGILPNEEQSDPGWFARINYYGRGASIAVKHYVVSSGIREMIKGTRIANQFEAIFASSFCYEHHGIAVWPALALNYTSKTQYLFRINKGCLDVSEHVQINKYLPENDRPVPFRNMIYIGDGATDIPCMRVVKDRGGCTIAVYKPHTPGARANVQQLVKEGRANCIASAKYNEGSTLDKIVKTYIDHLQFYYAYKRLQET